MTTLQRSSYSFRRQGSSGRIWDNVVQIPEITSKPSASAHSGGEFNYHPISCAAAAAPPPDSMVASPQPPSLTKSKVHRSALFSIFRCCVRSPAS